MGILDGIIIKGQIRKLLAQCPTDKIYFDDRFSFFNGNDVKFDILYIKKTCFESFEVMINDDIFDEHDLQFLPANMIYLKLQTLLREWDINNTEINAN